MKKYFLLLLVTCSIIASILFTGCADIKITVGKYYTENDTESYIEILEDDKILFKNVDFSQLEEVLQINKSPLSVDDVADKLSQPQKYDYYKGSDIEGYDYTIQVLFDGTEEDGGMCLTLRWSKENTLWCLDNAYSLQT